jgi:hypothetical protein
LYSSDSRFTIPFNTVSDEMIERVTAIVRTHRNWSGPADTGAEVQRGAAPSGASTVDSGSVADLYRSLIRKEQKRTGAVPIAYQQTVSLEKREKHLLDPLLDSIRRISLRPALVLAGPTEIVVYHAEPQIMRFGRGSYGYTRTELPYGALKDVEVEKSATFVASVELGFTVPGHTITVTVDDAFPVDTVEAAAAASRADV